ncbi:MAG TPA: MBL fold metallo-hydrolase [Bryobacteraceae bacterium]|nr:MBL fold metallo-hydrolase [Bryobacteraceae bacterium]
MNAFLCSTCGTEYPASPKPPLSCLICSEERQYIGLQGQSWTTLHELRESHANEFHPREPNLTAIRTEPAFAINQRAFLVETAAGNILWDCIALLDDATIQKIRERGGLRAIAISHPHYYTTVADWSRAFGDVPVYVHAADRQWVVSSDERLWFWEGEQLKLHDDITVIRCGGHFEGGAVLHWPAGANGKGVLLSGDIIQVVPDRRWVSFMYSYPNYIPLGAAAIHRILAALAPFEFDRVYGAFHPMDLIEDGKAAIHRSADRYLRAIAGELPG